MAEDFNPVRASGEPRIRGQAEHGSWLDMVLSVSREAAGTLLSGSGENGSPFRYLATVAAAVLELSPSSPGHVTLETVRSAPLRAQIIKK